MFLVQNQATAVVVPSPTRGSFVTLAERTAVFNDNPEKELAPACQHGRVVLPVLISSFYNFYFVWYRCGRTIPSLATNEKWRHQKIVPPDNGIGMFWRDSSTYSDKRAFYSSGGFSVVSEKDLLGRDRSSIHWG
jgi:hypothetical protein